MASICKVEYYVLNSAGEAVDWLDGKDDAIAAASKIGGSVEKVTSYMDDREVVWAAGDDGEEAPDHA